MKKERKIKCKWGFAVTVGKSLRVREALAIRGHEKFKHEFFHKGEKEDIVRNYKRINVLSS